MRSVGTRRAAQVAGFAAVAALALGGCSAGQVAETAAKKPSVPGVNVETADRSLAIRNLHVAYNGPKGYAAGENAPLEVSLVNQTNAPISVTISSRPPASSVPKQGVISAQRVGLSGGAAATGAPSADPEPSGSRPVATPDTDTPDNIPSPDPSTSAAPQPSVSAVPAGAALEPARISVPPMSSVIYLAADKEQLVASGLSDRLLPAQAVNLVFEFSNGAKALELQAPVTVPLSPAPRGSAENEGVGEDEGQIE